MRDRSTPPLGRWAYLSPETFALFLVGLVLLGLVMLNVDLLTGSAGPSPSSAPRPSGPISPGG